MFAEGIVPVNWLLSSCSSCRYRSRPREAGKGPEMLLSEARIVRSCEAAAQQTHVITTSGDKASFSPSAPGREAGEQKTGRSERRQLADGMRKLHSKR